MDARISVYYPSINKIKKTPVFGYSTKGIPGLEIIGLGKYGKSIKEKFIYLTRREKIKIPMKRYVLCVEGDPEDIDHILEHNRWFELPLFILYLSMAELLPIRRLDDCLCAGKIDVSGKITSADYTERVQTLLDENDFRFKLIAPGDTVIQNIMPLIPLEEIFRNMDSLNVA